MFISVSIITFVISPLISTVVSMILVIVSAWTSMPTSTSKFFKDYLGLGAGAIRINVLCLVSTCAEVRVMVEQLRKMKSYLRVSNCISIPNHKLQL